MASDGAKWSKDDVNALIDAYSDAKTSATTMSTNRELYASIQRLLEQNNDLKRSVKQIETKVKKLKSEKAVKAMIKQQYRTRNACMLRSPRFEYSEHVLGLLNVNIRTFWAPRV